MRIIHSLEGKSWSGGQQQALFLAAGQAKLGHEVLLMCQLGSELEKRAKMLGINTKPHDYRKELHPVSIRGLLEIYDAFRPHVVNVHRAWAHTQWFVAALLRRFHGLVITRRVLFQTGMNPLSLLKYRSPVVRGLIAVSRAVAERLECMGIKPRRIVTVYPATDTSLFDSSKKHDLNGPWQVPEGVPVALMVGNFNVNKGHLIVLDAFLKIASKWPQLHLVIAGHGTESGKLAAAVQKGGITDRIHLLGFRSDVAALFSRASFSLNASFEEGFSGTIRESLAMGVPVIASDISSNVELALSVPLLFFEAGSSRSLADKIIEMRDGSVTNIERGALREKTVRAFSVDTMVKKTLAAYQSFRIAGT